LAELETAPSDIRMPAAVIMDTAASKYAFHIIAGHPSLAHFF